MDISDRGKGKRPLRCQTEDWNWKCHTLSKIDALLESCSEAISCVFSCDCQLGEQGLIETDSRLKILKWKIFVRSVDLRIG